MNLHWISLENSIPNSFGKVYCPSVKPQPKFYFYLVILYKVLPNRKATFKSQIPGALIIAVAWSIFSYGFSFYFEIFPGFSNMYGNLATIIMVMVWLYICMNLLLYGAEINAYFEKEFRIAHKSVQELLAHEKEKKQQENE